MIINKSYHMIYPMFEKNLDMRYSAFNSYMNHRKYKNTITIDILFKDDHIDTGYESFGYVEFDKYLRGHNLYVTHRDNGDYISYTFNIPQSLNQVVSDLWHGDWEFITKQNYNEMTAIGQMVFQELKNKEIPLKRYKTYEQAF